MTIKQRALSQVAVAMSCLIASAAVRADIDPEWGGIEGRWSYDGSGREGEALLEEAFAHATSAMGIFSRPIATTILRRRNRFYEELTFTLRRDQAGRPLSAKLVFGATLIAFDGELARTQRRNIDGSVMDVVLRPDGATWLMVATNDHAERRTRFSPLSDGRLRVETEVTAEQLPRPLRYALSYRRR